MLFERKWVNNGGFLQKFPSSFTGWVEESYK
jgi:hypothetical protein